MKYLKRLTFLTLIGIIQMSCNGDNGIMNENYDCVFQQNDDDLDGIIDNNERRIMDECLASAFSTKSEIENNLIGEWALIGHGEGWVSRISQPCAYIIINEDELIYSYVDENTDTESAYLWEIIEMENNGKQDFRLTINPDPVQGFFFIDNFCEEYMFVNLVPSDGYMYLYQKLK